MDVSRRTLTTAGEGCTSSMTSCAPLFSDGILNSAVVRRHNSRRSTPKKWILSMLVQEGAWSSDEYQQWLSDTLASALVRS
jgi:hypothetical protein